MESEASSFVEQPKQSCSLVAGVKRRIERRREHRRIREEVRDFDLATRDGRAREFGLIEKFFGVKFESRPRIKGGKKLSCQYIPSTNTIALQPWMTLSGMRYAVWHESGHGLCEQSPLWKEFTKETLEKTRSGWPDKYPEAFLMLRDSVLEEGIVDVAMHFALRKIFPFMEKWQGEDIARLNNGRLRSINNPRWWLRRVLAEQQEIEETIARIESYPELPTEAALEPEVMAQQIKQVLEKLSLTQLFRNFSLGDSHRIGANFVFKLAKEQGLETIGEIVQAVTADPPKSWEELLGIAAS